MAQDVVIVGADGTEHVFPPGFDPKKAATIVRTKESKASTPTLGGMMLERDKLSTASHPIAEGEEAPPSSPLMESLGHLAHPQTTADFLGLVIPSAVGEAVHAGGDLVRKAGSTAARAVGRGVARGAAVAEDLASTHPAISAAVGGAIGAYHGGPLGALEGAVGGGYMGRILRLMQKAQKVTGKTPSLSEVMSTMHADAAAGAAEAESGPLSHLFTDMNDAPVKTPVATSEPAMAAREAPVPAGKIANDEAIARRRAEYQARVAATPTPEPVAVVDQPPTITTEPTTPTKTKPARKARTTPAQKPVPLSQAAVEMKQAGATLKPRVTAAEYEEGVRLRARGESLDDIQTAIQVQRDLKAGSSALSKMPTDTEVYDDLHQQAVSGKKSLMGKYGKPRTEPGNPYR